MTIAAGKVARHKLWGAFVDDLIDNEYFNDENVHVAFY